MVFRHDKNLKNIQNYNIIDGLWSDGKVSDYNFGF